MTLADVMKVIDEFSPEELQALREYIQEREQQIERHSGGIDIDALLRGLEEIRAGMSEEEFAEIERAMNEEFVEPLDADE